MKKKRYGITKTFIIVSFVGLLTLSISIYIGLSYEIKQNENLVLKQMETQQDLDNEIKEREYLENSINSYINTIEQKDMEIERLNNIISDLKE